ncbi:MAG: hypothetical protein WDA06_06525 [Phenylobacterium sp.]
MSNWYKFTNTQYTSTGVLKVNPRVPWIKKDTTNWLIIQVNPDLSRYYLELFNFHHRAKDLQIEKPAWGGHISIIRGENILDKEYFYSLQNKSIEFSYESDIVGNNSHYWLKVKCPEANEIRIKLGLQSDPPIPFHLTIGIVKKG